jgi:hypothetical protein
MSEHDAHNGLADTARMLRLDALRPDPLEDTQPMTVLERRTAQSEARDMSIPDDPDAPRERRKPSTVGERDPQRLADSDPEGHRQAWVDYLSDQENSK